MRLLLNWLLSAIGLLIVSYFMHLKYEKISLALVLIPSTIFCICMIIIFFMPDGARLMQMRLGH